MANGLLIIAMIVVAAVIVFGAANLISDAISVYRSSHPKFPVCIQLNQKYVLLSGTITVTRTVLYRFSHNKRVKHLDCPPGY
jgi:hypothetical protein